MFLLAIFQPVMEKTSRDNIKALYQTHLTLRQTQKAVIAI